MNSELLRPELYRAYTAVLGVPWRHGNTAVSPAFDRRIHGEEALRPPIMLSDREIARYGTYGFVRLKLSVADGEDDYLIDLSPLRDIKAPTHALLKRRTPDSLEVVVYSGKQSPPRRAIELEVGRTLEGLVVKFYFNVSPKRQIPYDTELIPLYDRE